jgi:DNA-directed RNA polymerase subunit H (RpoH/RPB5)
VYALERLNFLFAVPANKRAAKRAHNWTMVDQAEGQVVQELFALRGYRNISRYEERLVGSTVAQTVTAEATAGSPAVSGGPTAKVVCVWVPAGRSRSTIGKKDVQQYVCEAYNHYIFVVESMSVHAAALLDTLPVTWEAMMPVDAACPRHRSFLVPKYTRLTEAEILAVEKRHGPRRNFSRMIAKQDAMARVLNLVAGDVVRVVRPSATAGVRESYRLLVDIENG